MRKVLLVVLLGVCGFVCGCCGNCKFNCNFECRRVTINTEPEGAMVTQIRPMHGGKERLGRTPLKSQSVVVVSKITKMKNLHPHQTMDLMQQVDNVVVWIEKDGYEPCKRILEVKKDVLIEHNITLTAAEE